MKKKYSGWIVLFLLVLNQGCKVSQHKFNPEAASIRQSMLRAMAWQEANPIYAKAPTDWTNGLIIWEFPKHMKLPRILPF
jgi:hypothetical protein